MISPEQWLGQLLQTETSQPHEWPFVAWVVRNRVEARGFPDDYEGVILERRQFSFYNDLSGTPEEVFEQAGQRYPVKADAFACAVAVIGAARWEAPFGASVCHYYSPRSMVPAGRVPPWDWSILRPFTPAGIDSWRFVFAESVPRSHPGAGPPGPAVRPGMLRS